jgi:hypothetical protein
VDATNIENDEIIIVCPRMIETSFANWVTELDPETEILECGILEKGTVPN